MYLVNVSDQSYALFFQISMRIPPGFCKILYVFKKPIFQGLTRSSLTLHISGCSACVKKSQNETFLTLNLIFQIVLLTSPLPYQQNNDDMKSTN